LIFYVIYDKGVGVNFCFIRKSLRSIYPIVIALPLLTMHSLAEAGEHGNKPHIKVCKDVGHCVSSEIAVSPKARLLGLMFRDELSANSGMLFVFPYSDAWRFWMKNTKIPLDIVWLDEDKRVVFIVNDAQPCLAETCRDFAPEENARYVLELAAGVAKEWNLRIGDRLTFEIPQQILRNDR
jgi:uncharacterized membrane protein (UPF0127 family)